MPTVASLAASSVIHVLQQHLPLSVWGLTMGSPLCLRSLSFSLSFLSWEWERDLQRDSLDRERRCRDLLDRDEDRDRLLLGDLKHTRHWKRSHSNVTFFRGNALISHLAEQWQLRVKLPARLLAKCLHKLYKVSNMLSPDYPPVCTLYNLLPGTRSRPPAVASVSAVTPCIWDFSWIYLFGKTMWKFNFQEMLSIWD